MRATTMGLTAEMAEASHNPRQSEAKREHGLRAHEPVTTVRCCYGCCPKWTLPQRRAQGLTASNAQVIGGRQMHERLGLVGDLGVLEDGMRAASAFHCARAGREAIALRRGSARAVVALI